MWKVVTRLISLRADTIVLCESGERERLLKDVLDLKIRKSQRIAKLGLKRRKKLTKSRIGHKKEKLT